MLNAERLSCPHATLSRHGICDVRFNDVTILSRHIYCAIFFFNAEIDVFCCFFFLAFLNTNLLNIIFRRFDKQILNWAFWSSPLINPRP